MNKYLICHPYGSSWKNGSWTIPKGKKEESESNIDTAIREVKEETDIDINKKKGKILYLGTYEYDKIDKKLTIFLFLSEEDLTKDKLTCKSLIKEGKNKSKPEIDYFKWVYLEEAIDKLNKVTTKALIKTKNFYI
jgi:predicted NUDIX family NTP pyrophosphohydrolase